MTPPKIPVDSLSGVAETMLIPLYARYAESQRPTPIVHDPQSLQIIEHIDYDFSAFAKDAATQLGIAIRTEILDEFTRAFIAQHPDALILNLGAGLDTRFWRVDNGQITWVDLDLPESIDFRLRFLPTGDRQQIISHSALDFAWMEQVTPRSHILIIAEGLLIYFPEAEVKRLLLALQEHFPTAELLIETIGTHMLHRAASHASVSTTDARFQWAIDAPQDMESWHPTIHYLGDVSIYDRYAQRWQVLYPDLPKPLPDLRHKVTRIVHLRFG
jgi:O-methyltransferase involved in polyketide biosynthesis